MTILPAMLVLFAAGFAVSGYYGNRLNVAEPTTAILDEKTSRWRRGLLQVSMWACYLAATMMVVLAVILVFADVLCGPHLHRH